MTRAPRATSGSWHKTDLELKTVGTPNGDDLARLESEIAKNPTSEAARERFLEHCPPIPSASMIRVGSNSLEWFLEHNPQNSICTTPFMRVNEETAPEAYQKLKARWLALLVSAPADPQLVRGAANFVAAQDLEEAKCLLKAAMAQKPADAKLWLDLGRMSQESHE